MRRSEGWGGGFRGTGKEGFQSLWTHLRPFSGAPAHKQWRGRGGPTDLHPFQLRRPRPRSSLLSPFSPLQAPPCNVPGIVWLQLPSGLPARPRRIPCPPSLSPFALQSPLKRPAPAPAPLTLSMAFPTGGTLLSGSSSFSSVFTLLPLLATFFSILTAPGPTVSK